jgi:hypothetical protein
VISALTARNVECVSAARPWANEVVLFGGPTRLVSMYLPVTWLGFAIPTSLGICADVYLVGSPSLIEKVDDHRMLLTRLCDELRWLEDTEEVPTTESAAPRQVDSAAPALQECR